MGWRERLLNTHRLGNIGPPSFRPYDRLDGTEGWRWGVEGVVVESRYQSSSNLSAQEPFLQQTTHLNRSRPQACYGGRRRSAGYAVVQVMQRQHQVARFVEPSRHERRIPNEILSLAIASTVHGIIGQKNYLQSL